MAIPLSSRCAQILEREAGAQEAARRAGDHHLAGRRDPLQARRKVGRLADHRLLLRRALADQVADHHEPGRDADPGGERFAAGVVSRLIASTSASPARTARSASSSCARGQPK